MKNRLKRLTSIALTLVMALSISAVPGVSFAGETDSGDAANSATETKISSEKAAPIAVTQSGTCGKGVTWKFDDGTLTISGKGAMNDYRVSHGEGADGEAGVQHFHPSPWEELSDSIKKVVIGSGVTSIGNDAFSYCSSLTAITIPKNVTSIGGWAFFGCHSLTSVTMKEGVTSIGGWAFSYCSSLTSVTIPGSVKSIGEDAFFYCSSLTNVTIEEGVKSIGYSAFEGCSSLTNVTIPKSVTSIGGGAFGNCDSLADITVDKGNASYSVANGVLMDKGGKTIICYPAGRTGKTYTIPSTVNTINPAAFSGCYLTSITIPGSVKSIGGSAFSDCESLTNVTIEEGVKSIGEYTFSYCSSLTSVTIPGSVTSIGSMAFYGCDNLTIYGKKGSYAETYANDNDIPFKPIGSLPVPLPEYKPADNVKPKVNPSGMTSTGKVQLFRNASGSVGDKPIAKVYPGDFNVKFPAINTSVKKESNNDGTYTMKYAIGIDKSTAFQSDDSWNSLKKDIDKVSKRSGQVSQLSSLMHSYGASAESFDITSGFNAKPDISVMGYYEAVCDENGTIISDSGGAACECEWNGSKTQQWLVGPVPLYVEIGGKLKMAGKGQFAKNMAWAPGVRINIKPGLSAGAGVGISGVTTVGIEGSGDLNVQAVPATKGDLTAGISAKAELVFVFDWEYTLAQETFPLWDTTQNIKGFNQLRKELAGRAAETGDITLTDRDYQDKTTEWNGNVGSDKVSLIAGESNTAGVDMTELQGYILPNTIPKMAKAGSDIVMVFQSNDPSRATENSVRLMYSVYNGSKWSTPKAVWDNGTLDAFADLKTVNGELYVVWQKCKQKLSGAGDEAKLDSAMANSEICYSKYESGNKTFSVAKYLTDNSTPDTMPLFIEGSEKPAVMWVSRAENDATDLNAEQTVRFAELSDTGKESPQTLAKTTGYISELSGICKNGTYSAAYICSKEGQAPALFTAKGGTEKKVAPSDSSVPSGLYCTESAIVYNEDGVLKQYDPEGKQVTDIKAGETAAISPNAKIIKSGDKNAVLWMTNEEDGCALYSAVDTGKGYSEPVEVFRDEKLNGSYFTAALDEDGSWSIVLCADDRDESGKTSMFFIRKAEDPKLVLNDVLFSDSGRDQDTMKQEFSYSVTNDSEKKVTGFQLTVTANGETLLTKSVSSVIGPGETVYLNDTADLSSLNGKSEADLNVQVTASGQKDNSENTKKESLDFTDFEVTAEKTLMRDSATYIATITNKGSVASAGTVTLYGDADKTRVIQKEDFSKLAPGESATVELAYPITEMSFNEEKSAFCQIYVDTGKEESNSENNSYYGVVYYWELPEDSFNIANFELTGADKTYTYTGSEIRPAVSVKGLKAGTDYSVSYKDNINAGTAKAVLTGKGKYTGTATKAFTIKPRSINNATVTGIVNKTWTGKPVTQNITVKDGSRTLKNGTDYTVTYSNNVNAGTAIVTISAKGNYTGSIAKTFTISKPASAAKKNQTITCTSSFTKAYGSKAFSLGAKAKTALSYKSSNTKVATVSSKGTVTIKGVGKTVITITAKGTSTYNGATKKVTITVTKGKQTISGASKFSKTTSSKAFYLGAKAKGKLSYKTSNKKVATVSSKGKVTVKGVGKATITITAKGTSTYNGATKKVTITVTKPGQKISGVKSSYKKTYGSKSFYLKAKAKGKISYKSGSGKVAAVNSKGKVTIKGPGKTTIAVTAAATSKYAKTTKKITITVTPKKISSIKASAGKKKMSVSWKKTSKVSGYQIVYAQNSKFTKGKKAVNVSYKTSKKTISKLTSKKTYYVKVRAYKTVGKTKIYGSYSGAKKVRVK